MSRVKDPPSWFRPALLAICAVFLIGLFSTEIADYDFWWTLKSGQFIAQNHRLPVPDPFAFTTRLAHDAYPGESVTRQFNLTFEWLAQLKLYSIYRLAGFGGIVLFRALLLTGCCALIGAIVWRRTSGFYRALAAAFATAAVLWPDFAHDRSYLFTFLFLAATLAILEYRRWLWALPIIAIVWANCHGGFFLGWIAVAAYCAEALYLRRVAHTNQDRELWIVAAVSIAASAINPNGFRVIEVLGYFRHSFLQSKLLEWTAPALWPISPFSALLFLGAAAMLWARSRVRIADWLLFAAFTAAALSAQRNIFMIGFWAPVVIASYLPFRRAVPAIAQFVAAALVFAALAIGLARGAFFQFRVAAWRFPSGAADFVLAHGVISPMFNTYEFGGYLIWRLWPEQRVFIDGRALSESIFNDYARILYNHSNADGGKSGLDLLDQYGIQTIVVNAFEYSEGQVYNLILAISTGLTEWKLVYSDPQAVVFMRQPPTGVEILDPSLALNHMESECALHLDREPRYTLCARALGTVFSVTGQPSRARQWLGIYLSLPHDPDPDAQQAYARLLSQGK
jgi:hypothetical protein